MGLCSLARNRRPKKDLAESECRLDLGSTPIIQEKYVLHSCFCMLHDQLWCYSSISQMDRHQIEE